MLQEDPGTSFFADLAKDLQGILSYHGKPVNFRNVLWGIFAIDAYLILVTYRLRCLARRYHIPVVNRLLRGFQTAFYAIEIGNDVTLGHGVYFLHSLGTVVGQNVVIGANTVFYGNNTVGAARESGTPRIGANVRVGAGARILGDIQIGDFVTVGANAVVLESVTSQQTVVGVPARVVRSQTSRAI